MEYVVVDFEWNQSPYGKKTANKRLPFEIIEIGAIKLDENGEEIDRFEAVIKPKVYRKMHYVTRNLTGITEKDLNQGMWFPNVLVDFMLWCGEDFMFCTWGNLDLLELQRNMKFYHLADLLPGPIKYYNVQKLFRIFYDNNNLAASLEHAVEFLHIGKVREFHRAINDARYTADIFSMMDQEEIKKWYTIDYYQNPKNRKEEIKLVYETYAKYISQEFKNKEAAMSDREVRSTKCYKCNRIAAKRLRWFTGKNKAYYCLAECPEHGYLRGKIRLKKTDGNQIFVVKTLRLIDEAEAKQIISMKEEVRHKRQEKRHRESAHES